MGEFSIEQLYNIFRAINTMLSLTKTWEEEEGGDCIPASVLGKGSLMHEVSIELHIHTYNAFTNKNVGEIKYRTGR